MGELELMRKWRKRAHDRLIRIYEAEAKIEKLEEVNAFLVVEAQRQAADARIWEHRFKSLSLNKIPGCGEV